MKATILVLAAVFCLTALLLALPESLPTAAEAGEPQKAVVKKDNATDKKPAQAGEATKQDAGQGGGKIAPTSQAGSNSNAPQPASDQTQWTVSKETAEVIFVFLILSVVFEVALAPIFDSSVYMTWFEDKGIKSVITFALAFFVFWSYNLDIFERLLDSMKIPTEASFGGRVVTALLIAGGSGGFHKILANLGVRMKPEERQIKAQAVKSMHADRLAQGKPQQGS